jgi:K+-transporting ATPase ATPase B chain
MVEALYRFNPRALFGSPILFTLWLAAVMATLESLLGQPLSGVAPSLAWQLTAWLWLTLWFANFAETLAEGRGKARADSLKAGMSQLKARRVTSPQDDKGEWVPATSLLKGDLVLVRSGEMIPADGEVVAGIASVNEAAITGESAPVIRESGTDRSGVTGNTTVVSDEIWVRITNNPGESTLDRMIALVEGPSGRRPQRDGAGRPAGRADLIFLLVVATLPWFLDYNGTQVPRLFAGAVHHPDPDHHRRSALRHRHRRHGPAGEAQRDRQVGPRGGSRRRRAHPAAGQDRHHHLRQPDGGRADPAPASPPCWPGRHAGLAR